MAPSWLQIGPAPCLIKRWYQWDHGYIMEVFIFKPLATEPLTRPEADAALYEALCCGLDRDKVAMIELDLYINDSAFPASIIAHFLEMKKNQAYD